MVIKTILNFTGLYFAFQLLVGTISQVFNIDLNSGAQIGVLMGSAYGAMAASVSAFGRTPTRRENWILSLWVNLIAPIVSSVCVITVLFMSEGAAYVGDFIAALGELPVLVWVAGFAIAFLLQTLICLLIFGRGARRYLAKVQRSEAAKRASQN
ncbi:ABZJ_00895 family protein [Marinobacter sp. C2H3]|uniref:ABZJ_00895 family protein n=1 Tax=Marinobacter sp. C2H3 TaxID=3119003 RepID=UPI00300F2C52